MSSSFTITSHWQALNSGSAEERNCFSKMEVRAGEYIITLVQDKNVNSLRPYVYLSAYHLAEWLAWNWWRLRWEPRLGKGARKDWGLAHCFPSIGHGYVWPNLDIHFDGRQIVLCSKSTQDVKTEMVRYTTEATVALSAEEFEEVLDNFFSIVEKRLLQEGTGESNFLSILRRLRDERGNTENFAHRQMEAQLGFDPDEAPGDLIRTFLDGGREFGVASVRELAFDRIDNESPLTVQDLVALSNRGGLPLRSGFSFPTSPFVNDGIFLPAWQLGERVADEVRQANRLGEGILTSGKLAELCGVDASIFGRASNSKISFAIGDNSNARMVLRKSNKEEALRFDAARVFADRLAFFQNDRLFPSARQSYSYRQRYQRALAAQLLCPYRSLKERLAGDYSNENQEEIAATFQVSPYVVKSSLMNHGDLPLDYID